jgi:pimeloyl-ACP methyl ester carboxylesterase
MTRMPTLHANGIDLHYDTIGDPDDVPLLLVMGLGAQMTAWDDDFCQGLADRGFYVARYDNRDVGLSSQIDSGQHHDGEFLALFMKAAQGEPIEAPYLLTDMAADAVAVLDELGIDAAHVVGASMGGMIAQTVAIEHPDRVLTLTSIMSTTGEREVGQATPEAIQRLMAPRPSDRESAIDFSVETSRVIGSPDHFDETRTRAKAAEFYDRAFYPSGIARQMLAILASGSRADALGALDLPTLVIHGDVDPLVTPSGGARTAELVPGAELLVIEGMGHDLPPAIWPQIIDAITTLAASAQVAS